MLNVEMIIEIHKSNHTSISILHCHLNCKFLNLEMRSIEFKWICNLNDNVILKLMCDLTYGSLLSSKPTSQVLFCQKTSKMPNLEITSLLSINQNWINRKINWDCWFWVTVSTNKKSQCETLRYYRRGGAGDGRGGDMLMNVLMKIFFQTKQWLKVTVRVRVKVQEAWV